ASTAQDFLGSTRTSLPAPLAAQPTVFHTDRLIEADRPACVGDFVVAGQPDGPQPDVGRRFLWLGYPASPIRGGAADGKDMEWSSGIYVPLAADGTLFFGRYGERRNVDGWQPSQQELYDRIAPCPNGPAPDDPKDCPETSGIP